MTKNSSSYNPKRECQADDKESKKVKLALVKLSDMPNEPLNLLNMAAYLDKKLPNLCIKIIDRAYDDVIKEILNFRPDIVGISSMTVEYPLSIKLCKKIKENIDALVTIGGTHLSFLPNSFDSCFDVGIVGEGEIPLLKIIETIERKGKIDHEDYDKMDGVVFFKGNKLIIHPQIEFLTDLDDIPIPRRESLNKDYFTKRPFYVTGKYKRWNSIITSRGCPYNCKFCISTKFFKKLRLHSARRVVDEIKYLYEKCGTQHINIWDDLFCCSIPRVREIVELLEEEGLLGKITFNTNIRGNMAKDEIFDLYKKMGVKAIGLGIESGSDKILRYLKGNNITVEQNIYAIAEGKRRGFKMVASLMIGVPGEKVEDMEKSYELVKKCIELDIDRLFFFILTPFPGCEIWDIAQQKGKVSQDMDFAKLSFHDEIPMLMDEDVNVEEYLKVRRKILKLMDKIKYKCFIEYLKDDPIKTIGSVAASPINMISKAIGIKNEKEDVSDI